MTNARDSAKLLQHVAQTLGLNQVTLADALGTSQSNVNRWLMGSKMPYAVGVRALDLIGGDISRALPDYTPPDPDHQKLREQEQRIIDLEQLVTSLIDRLEEIQHTAERAQDDDLARSVRDKWYGYYEKMAEEMKWEGERQAYEEEQDMIAAEEKLRKAMEEEDDDLLSDLTGIDSATREGFLGAEKDSAHQTPAPPARPSGPASPSRRKPAKKAP